MKYEIINPSDQCHLESEDEKVAIAACILLARGSYGLKRPDGTQALPLIKFGGSTEFLEQTFGSPDQFLEYSLENETQIADCLDTVTLVHSRTSMNDIRGAARTLAKQLRDRKARAAGVSA